MATLSRGFHWQTFTPNIGDNLELLADQLTLELAVGLSKVELMAFERAVHEAHGGPEWEEMGALLREYEAAKPTLTDETAKVFVERLQVAAAKRETAYAAKLGEAWVPFVRLGPGHHSVNGATLAGLADYLGFVLAQAGQFNFLELIEEVRRLNSVTGTRALFSDASSGGPTSTRPPNGAKAGSPTAGR